MGNNRLNLLFANVDHKKNTAQTGGGAGNHSKKGKKQKV